jgi:hypothetical protein
MSLLGNIPTKQIPSTSLPNIKSSVVGGLPKLPSLPKMPSIPGVGGVGLPSVKTLGAASIKKLAATKLPKVGTGLGSILPSNVNLTQFNANTVGSISSIGVGKPSEKL